MSLARYVGRITPSSVGTAVDASGRVLLLRRARAPFAGLWTMPGGKIEPAEQPRAAMEREYLEETGLPARVARFCGLVSEIVRSPEGTAHFILHVFRLQLAAGGPPGEDFPDAARGPEGELAWFRPEEIWRRDDVAASDVWMLRHLLLQEGAPRLVEIVSDEADPTRMEVAWL
ncbi:MAG: NUDIX domain-containing protein [Firmicutes bacterium]|nr:NUDIX domain-containing protein [Bacillota bacterium]